MKTFRLKAISPSLAIWAEEILTEGVSIPAPHLFLARKLATLLLKELFYRFYAEEGVTRSAPSDKINFDGYLFSIVEEVKNPL